MEKENLLERLENRMKKINEDINLLDSSQKEALIKIEPVVIKCFEQQDLALEMLKQNKININNIAKSGAISNKTIYKYDVVVKYIKYCENEYAKKLPKNSNANKITKEKLFEAQEIIRKMDLHFVDTEILKNEIEILTKSSQADFDKIHRLTEENIMLHSELRKIKTEHPEIFANTLPNITEFKNPKA